MKKFKKFIKVFAIIVSVLFVSCILTGIIYYHAVTSAIALDTNKIEAIETTTLTILDKDKKSISPANETYTNINDLKPYTKDAFICAEDKRFYSHSGIDYIRVGGAMISNLKSRSFSQGASTISQQLIKNTHLSNEKTINRKLKEFKLTRELEKKYSKDKILEMYLNNIYFGNGCYGIENASKHYFSKSAKDLTLSESALLAGTINAPSIYDIQNKPDKALERRNLILGLMHSYGKISEKQKESAITEELNLNITKLSNNNFLFNEIINEACEVLKVSENEIRNKSLTIETNIDSKLQSQITKIVNDKYSNLPSLPAAASIVVDNETNSIVAIVGSKNVFTNKRQPGSLIKPILVYAPAIEQKIVSPATKILDSKYNSGGYSPENADKKYHGFVSVRESLKNSYNIPSVKLLNELGTSNAQNFANKLGIEFSPNDNNLAIALGGFTEGVTIKNLCDAYSAFANNGDYLESKYISKIKSKNNIIYERKINRTNAMSDSTAYLITDMLIDTAKSGTAKRLKNLDFVVASKTGTVGLSNSNKNSDSYNAAYTKNHTIISYIGNSIMPENINGATFATMLSKDVLLKIYANKKPDKFNMPDSVIIKNISKNDYNNNIISLTENPNDSIAEYFAKDNLPKTTNTSFNPHIVAFNFANKKPILSFNHAPNYSVKLIRKDNLNEEIILSEEFSDTPKIIKFEDKSAQNGKIYEYFAEFCEKQTNQIIKSNTIKLKVF